MLIGIVGGIITGISPCVLPVLPVVFLAGGVQDTRSRRAAPASGHAAPAAGEAVPRADQAAAAPSQAVSAPGEAVPGPGRRGRVERRASRRPYLVVAGLAVSFSAFTLLGTLVLSVLPLPTDIVRWAGLVALVLLGVAMMFPSVQHLLERPFARIGQRQVSGEHGGFVLGLALGAVYVPCAGPVLAAITVAGATGRIGLGTVALTVAFACGTALPLLGFALAGRGVAERVRAFRDRERGVRLVAGAVMIALAVALTFNVTDALQRTVPDYTASLNKDLDSAGVSAALGSDQAAGLTACAQEPRPVPQNCGKAPAISGIQQWLNTPDGAPVTAADLAGKVVLVDFWAYSCINCQRAIPHVQAWYSAYKAAGLVVIGVHTPEYAFEHVPANVAAGARRLHITYPVAVDNGYTTWNNFGNDSWPAEYLIDATGQVRHVAIGEGDYSTTESLIRQLLTAAHPAVTLPASTDVADTTPDDPDQTPETYLGAERVTNGVQEPLGSGRRTFSYPQALPEDAFALTGTWTVGEEALTAEENAGIELSFFASAAYLDVGGTGTITATLDGKTTTYQVSGAPNIYTLADRPSPGRDTLTVTLSPGLTAYSFTFG
ncbi:cytochrome c biogenesis protein DipZ [Pseudofrankia inefficax]|uniref:Redoxin domain protein n=1 Tax=Pseudofrankia inefficax (strain DSM 45817 / CECT 9037 / DDB 130130 / EuI1c) TaxID=298654 RepID=E3J5I7_PSEI1|nr:cytochrome c biogenesis protein CcdA [Pseudofrankia inefficax]ADP81931.1 Redoxin domain protein [Pseudofrankia inefficax]